MGGLFLYGVGYGSAASGCMAPIVLGLLLASLERGIVTGLVVFLLFAVTTGLLMVAFTLLVASSEDTIVNKLRASTHQIQIVGGAVMVIVGVYLVWFYLSISTSLL
jgi:cytochrome c-type biogenesis protein